MTKAAKVAALSQTGCSPESLTKPTSRRFGLSLVWGLQSCLLFASSSLRARTIIITITNISYAFRLQIDISCRNTKNTVNAILTRTNFVTLKYVTDGWGTDANGFKLVITSVKDPSKWTRDWPISCYNMCSLLLQSTRARTSRVPHGNSASIPICCATASTTVATTPMSPCRIYARVSGQPAREVPIIRLC